MLSIDIVCAGKLKETHWHEACKEFQKRLTPLCKLTIVEQPEGKQLTFPDDRAFTIALCVEGEPLSSEQFSHYLWQTVDGGHSKLRFLIGGSDGLFEQDKQRARLRLSLSHMTFTHAMARVFLLEQLYRAFMIRDERAYHK